MGTIGEEPAGLHVSTEMFARAILDESTDTVMRAVFSAGAIGHE